MTDARNPGHPSPDRAQASLAALVFGLAGAPAAWYVQLLASFGIAQQACYPKTTPLAAPAFGGLSIALPAFNVIALVVAIAAGVVAYRCWRRSRAERGGDGHALIEIGEGRARFMAMAGILTSLGFVAAILFTIPAFVAISGC